MSECTISVACPGCKAVFELSSELGGELGECTECGAIFEIPRVDGGLAAPAPQPAPAPAPAPSVPTSDTGSVKKQKPGATNTVKLSRASIGMVPDVKDNFKFQSVSTHTAMTGTKTHKKHSAASSSSIGKPMPPSQVPAAKSSRPWWKKILFFWK